MCCRLSVNPIPLGWPLILEIAGFEKIDGSTWMRKLTGCSVTVRKGGDSQLDFSLTPSIGGHTFGDHAANAVSAAIQFQTAIVLAEQADSRIVQRSIQGACNADNGGTERLLADYPVMPLIFSHLCLGFREILLKGIGQEEINVQ